MASSKPAKEKLSASFNDASEKQAGVMIGGAARKTPSLEEAREEELRERAKKRREAEEFERAARPEQKDAPDKGAGHDKGAPDAHGFKDAYLIQDREIFRKRDMESPKGQVRAAKALDKIIHDAVMNRDWDVLVVGGGRRAHFVRELLADRLEMYKKDEGQCQRLFGADAEKAIARLQTMSVSFEIMSNKQVASFTEQSALKNAGKGLELPSSQAGVRVDADEATPKRSVASPMSSAP